jgi:hypothetical protein
MIIIGVDFHPEFQQIAWVDTDNGGVPGTATATPGGSGKVLSRSRGPGNEGARGDGGERAFALV